MVQLNGLTWEPSSEYPQPLFDGAVSEYGAVAKNLEAVSKTFPFLHTSNEEKVANIGDRARCEKAVSCLKAAREAEVSGLKVLERIVAKMA